MTTAITVTTQHVNAGNYGIVDRSTDDESLVELWLNSGKRADSPLTQDAYQRTWYRFAASVGRPLQSVTLDDLQAWRKRLTGKPATIRAQVATVRSLFAFAVKVGYLRMNPAVMIEAPKAPTKAHTQRVVSQGAVERLVEACQTPREVALVRTLYSSAGRVSEVLALRWRDVTPRDNGGALLYIAHGKGDKDRKPGINAATYAALLRLREGASEDDFVFRTRTGKALDRQAAHALIKRVAKRAGVSGSMSAHWLRHSHATHALERGANVADVCAQLGHASLATTTTYAHATSYSSDKLAI